MSNSFVALPVPAGDGVGAWVDTSALAGTKTVSVDGGAFSGTLYIEGSNDGQTTAARVEIMPFIASQVPAVVTSIWQWMRVRRSGTGLFGVAGSPTVKVAAEAASSNVFGAMAVGVDTSTPGVPIDLSAGGPVNTFSCVGVGAGRLVIEVSADASLTWSPAVVFEGGAQTSRTLVGVVHSARVQARIPSGTLAVAVGSGEASGAGGGGGAEIPEVPGTQVQVNGVAGSQDYVAGTFDNVYPWGVLQNFSGWDFAGNGYSPENRLTAIPHLFPIDVTIRDIIIQNQAVGPADGPASFTIGIYSNRAANLPYPLTKLFNSAEVNPPLLGSLVTIPVNLAVAAGTLLWLVYTRGGSEGIAQLDLSSLLPASMMGPGILGTFSTFGSPYAWTGIEYTDAPYNTVLPVTFPTAAPNVSFTGDPQQLPAFMIRFGP